MQPQIDQYKTMLINNRALQQVTSNKLSQLEEEEQAIMNRLAALEEAQNVEKETSDKE